MFLAGVLNFAFQWALPPVLKHGPRSVSLVQVFAPSESDQRRIERELCHFTDLVAHVVQGADNGNRKLRTVSSLVVGHHVSTSLVLDRSRAPGLRPERW